MSGKEPLHDTDTTTISDTSIHEPSFYRVVLLNDDFTPMDFVVELIMKFFGKSAEEATHIMLSVHNAGVGVCGLYPREIAETKVSEVNTHARRHGHPLTCRMEKE